MKRLTLRRILFAALAPVALGAAAANAGPLFNDPYGVGAPDVVGGSLGDHDIRSLEIKVLTPTRLEIDIDLNYYSGISTALGPFPVFGTSYAAVPLRVGDVLIQGQSFLWAIPLAGSNAGGPGGVYSVGGPVATGTPITRGDVLPGSLYRVTGALTAAQVLGADPADDFRPDALVWGMITDPSPTHAGVRLVESLGGPEFMVHVGINIGSQFYNDVSGGFGVQFASTTCACDVLSATVPEPSQLALAFGALALFALRGRLCFPRRGGAGGRELD